MAAVLGPGGVISKRLAGYESRPAQVEMAETVAAAIASGRHAVIEGGTGVGKSLAYLIPAVYSGKKVVVSTANKALQDQLVSKDIPFLQLSLPREVSAALVKGRSNYLCLDRFDAENAALTLAGRTLEFQRLARWAATTASGDFEEIETPPRRDLMMRLASTTRSCIGNACVHYNACFIEKMRARAAEADIVVCNHALLLADLVLRDFGHYLLPDRDLVIVDEAHRLEDAALGALSVSLRRRDMMELLESHLLERFGGPAVGRLGGLIDALFHPFETVQGQTRTLPITEALGPALALSATLQSVYDHLGAHNPYGDLMQRSEATRHYVKLMEWCDRLMLDCRAIGQSHDPDEVVRYVDYPFVAGARAAVLHWSPIDVATPLRALLFTKTPVICTSATLAVSDFAYFRHAVGILDEDDAVEMTAPSPFDYPTQALLYVPAHLPEFRSSATAEYSAALVDEMESLVKASGGGAFLLFTSYRGLEDAFAVLAPRLEDEGYTVLKQGGLPRPELMRRFREDGAAILFAVKSFWEGVDVAGEALSLVVIDRMPFSVPDDPIVAARVARLKREGGDWFDDLMLPAAILQLKQGFGRLIRRADDRGVVAILDSRLARKGYGKRVIAALPPARLVHHIEQVEEFYAQGRPEDGV